VLISAIFHRLANNATVALPNSFLFDACLACSLLQAQRRYIFVSDIGRRYSRLAKLKNAKRQAIEENFKSIVTTLH
tara:strand:- start:130249 stop:130476 length:228 start_codon:yes stop_codon:yes gene_type:complete